MKKIISILAIIFCVAFFTQESKAQGNLQFNQVVIINVVPSGITTFTVPAGKVWKIESAGMGGSSSSAIILRDASANPVAYFYGASFNTSFPFWLPSSFSGSFQAAGVNGYRAIISIIEFNVVP